MNDPVDESHLVTFYILFLACTPFLMIFMRTLIIVLKNLNHFPKFNKINQFLLVKSKNNR